MIRRRKRKGGVWLPPDPYNTIAFGSGPILTPTDNIIKSMTVNMPNARGVSALREDALVGDFNEASIAGLVPVAAANMGATLADMTWGYSLQRIVGKIWIQPEQDNVSQTAANSWIVTAGIIVRAVADNGVSLTLNPFPDTYDAMRDPWVWRRSWIVSNLGANFAGSDAKWPTSNLEVPGTLDGSHVDQKTRRTVKAEERLFLDISAVALNGAAEEQTTTLLYIYFDFRFFGRVFQSAGNRRNASR